MNKNTKKSFLRNGAVQAILASLICIVLGLFFGYIALLLINPAGAGKALVAILKNFLYYPSSVKVMQYFGSTLVKTAPLLLCSLSVLFAYKVGLFNIGAAGQYVAGAGACLYAQPAIRPVPAGFPVGAVLACMRSRCRAPAGACGAVSSVSVSLVPCGCLCRCRRQIIRPDRRVNQDM